MTQQLKKIKLNQNSKLISLDIKDMYTNIPVSETIYIINLQLQKLQENPNFIKQLINSLQVVLKQNYFTFNEDFYNQMDGLPMGSPISPIMSEIFLQYLEDQYIEKIKKQFNITYYCRFVDDIFIIYENSNDILHKFNNIHSKLQYTLERQQNNSLNYLDLNIQNISCNQIYKFQYKIFRKPTTVLQNFQLTTIPITLILINGQIYIFY